MRLRRLIHVLTVLAAVVALTAHPARANAPAVNDCTAHLRLTRHYTVAELQQALASMSADVREYTDCSDVLQRALDDQLSGRHVTGGGSGSGGSFLPLPLLIALVAIVLVGAGYGVDAARRRRGGEPDGGGESADPSPPAGHLRDP